MKGNIKCECYWNNEGFEVARKYLYKKNIYGEKFDRIPLNDLIRENLEWIGEKYDGVERTMEVLELIDSYYSYPEECC